MTQSFDRTRGYFEGTKQVFLRTFSRHFVPGNEKESRCHRLRRLNVQEQIRQRFDYYDDRFAGICFV